MKRKITQWIDPRLIKYFNTLWKPAEPVKQTYSLPGIRIPILFLCVLGVLAVFNRYSSGGKGVIGIIGSSGVVSEVVNGKRSVSKVQAKALGDYFQVSPSLFI